MITSMVQYLYDNGTTTILPLPTNLCNTVYANDPQFITTLNDPQSTFICVDITNTSTPLEYTPAQYGFPQKLVLESTTCGVAQGNWFTKFRIPFPYPDLVCNTDLLASGLTLNLTTEVVTIGRQFSASLYKNGDDELEEMPWFLINHQVASYLNNTRLTIINGLQFVDNTISNERLINKFSDDDSDDDTIRTLTITGTNNWVY